MTDHDSFLRQLGDRLSTDAVVTDPADLEPRLVDWRKVYRGRAIALVRPRDVSEVAATVRVAAEHGVAIVPQGGNTGLSGGATPLPDRSQIVLSLERMARIRAVDRVGMTVEADAGCVVEDVKRAAEDVGRLLPIGFGAQGSAHIGGIVSTNAGGVNALRYGTTRQLVLGLEAVLADGTVLHGLRGLRKDNAGYDWKQILIGSEGTLGIVTGALLRLVPRPRERESAWISVTSPTRALELLERLLDRMGDSIVAFELMSHASVSKGTHYLDIDLPVAESAWHVLVEVADSAGELKRRLEEGLLAAAESGLLEDAVPAATDIQRERFWTLREGLGEAERHAGATAKHDVAVSVSDVPAFLEEAERAALGVGPGLSINAYGHLADGNVHFNVMLGDGGVPVEAVGRAVHDVVARFDGSISAEHGIGRGRVDELERLKPPAELELMRKLKHALDPQGLLNPGKVLASRG